MIKFKQKKYTIPEGHYTGPKDLENIPGTLSTVAKGAGIGAVVGGIAGKFRDENVNIIDSALSGAKYGTLGGIALKLLVNYIHKPMSTIKYQEVDRNIRRQFGIYQLSGVTVGDNLDRRSKLEDRFSFGDREVSKYKLNFAIHNNQITMYTFGITKEELDDVSKILDYYCKKYYSMEYTASIINQKVNSYSVNITFTNYNAIGQFIMELSNKLNTKINLLDNNSIVMSRITEASNNLNLEDKEFSVSKYDLMKVISAGLRTGLSSLFIGFSGSRSIVNAVQSMASELLEKNSIEEAQDNGDLLNRGSYNTNFLKKTLKKLHYIEGYHYTVGSDKSEINISLVSGTLLITTTKDYSNKFDEAVWKHLKNKIQRKELTDKKVVIYLYTLDSINEFEMILKKILTTGVPNIFDKEIKFRRR